MIDNRRVLIATALAGLALGGCGAEMAAEGNKATGEVLEGTISDAMIATDLVRSEPPVAPRRATAADPKEAKAKTGNADDAAPAGSPSPQASPPAEASPPPPEPREPPA